MGFCFLSKMSLFLDQCAVPDDDGLRAWSGADIARFLPRLSGALNCMSDAQVLECCRVADPKGCYTVIPGHMFHPTPEVFIQLSGATQFLFPAARMRLEADALLFVPAGLPHLEKIPGKRAAFANLVMMFQRRSFIVHIAFCNRYGQPQGTQAVQWKSPYVDKLLGAIDHLSAARELGLAEAAIAGLIRAFFGTVAAIISATPVQASRFSPRIEQCMHLVRTQLADADLSVAWLARELNVSPDYLSHQFATETGEKLSRYINRQRVGIATSLLLESGLSVVQIAHTVGFRHAGYFIRVFRSFHGASPGSLRRAQAQ